jgi:uncharacterized protein
VTSQTRQIVVAAGLAVSLLAGCGHSPTHSSQPKRSTPPGAPRLTFGYSRSQPLGNIDRGVVARRGSIAVHDVAYLSGGVPVAAYLVEPPGRQRRPAIVLVHGSGGDRRELLDAGVALARRGAVALTITEPSSVGPPPAATSAKVFLAQTRMVTVRDVVAIRRAADVLASLPIVDRRRLGYLGWSAGAKAGAFVAASDHRFRALALLSAGADNVAAFVAAAPAPLRPLVRRELGSVDPLRYIAWASPTSLLLEDGRRDQIVPRHALLNMVHAAPRGTLVRWYPAGHALNAAAYKDAYAWLLTKLAAR